MKVLFGIFDSLPSYKESTKVLVKSELPFDLEFLHTEDNHGNALFLHFNIWMEVICNIKLLCELQMNSEITSEPVKSKCINVTKINLCLRRIMPSVEVCVISAV